MAKPRLTDENGAGIVPDEFKAFAQPVAEASLRQQRLEAAKVEVDAVLAKYGVTMIPVIEFRGGQVVPRVEITSL